MTWEAVHKALEVAFANDWSESTDISWTNQPFIPDKTVDPDSVKSPYVRFRIIKGAGEIIGVGAKRLQFRNVGIVFVSVFTAEDTGEQSNACLCDLVASIFDGRQFSAEKLFCQASGIDEVGATNGWWQVNVSIPFYWDKFFPIIIADVSNFVAISGDEQISLSWVNPTTEEFVKTLIRRDTGVAPPTPTSGTFVADIAGTSFVDTGLTNGIEQFYTAFAHD